MGRYTETLTVHPPAPEHALVWLMPMGTFQQPRDVVEVMLYLGDFAFIITNDRYGHIVPLSQLHVILLDSFDD